MTLIEQFIQNYCTAFVCSVDADELPHLHRISLVFTGTFFFFFDGQVHLLTSSADIHAHSLDLCCKQTQKISDLDCHGILDG